MDRWKYHIFGLFEHLDTAETADNAAIELSAACHIDRASAHYKEIPLDGLEELSRLLDLRNPLTAEAERNEWQMIGHMYAILSALGQKEPKTNLQAFQRFRDLSEQLADARRHITAGVTTKDIPELEKLAIACNALAKYILTEHGKKMAEYDSNY